MNTIYNKNTDNNTTNKKKDSIIPSFPQPGQVELLKKKSNLGWNPLAADQTSKVAEEIRSRSRYKQYREDVDKYISYWANEFSKK